MLQDPPGRADNRSMPYANHRIPVLGLAIVLAVGSFASVSPVATVAAADPPWTLPTVPVKCTTAQINAGDVGTCVITLGSALPESRGWPAPPYPRRPPSACFENHSCFTPFLTGGQGWRANGPRRKGRLAKHNSGDGGNGGPFVPRELAADFDMKAHEIMLR